jgi:hypothetical protein
MIRAEVSLKARLLEAYVVLPFGENAISVGDNRYGGD